MKIAKPKQTAESKRFKAFRLELNLTQVELAEKLNREQPTIQKYESGALEVPSDVVRLLNKEFKMSFDFWYKGTGPKRVGAEKGNIVVDLGTIKTNQELLEQRVKKLEDMIRSLIVKQSYDKHGIK